MLQTQLNGEGRLAYTTVTENDKLVQDHSARHDGRLGAVEELVVVVEVEEGGQRWKRAWGGEGFKQRLSGRVAIEGGGDRAQSAGGDGGEGEIEMVRIRAAEEERGERER